MPISSTETNLDTSLADGSSMDSASGNGSAADYFALLKPRVMSLVIFTALVGMLLAPVPVHPVWRSLSFSMSSSIRCG